MLSILFYSMLCRDCLPFGLETADRIHIVRINDSVFDLEIGGCIARTQRSNEFDDFMIKLTEGSVVRAPEIQFAVRVGYPRVFAGLYFVKFGKEYLVTKRPPPDP